MGVTVIGWASLVKAGTMSASSAATGLGAANLQGDICAPSTGWQSAAAALTGVTVRCDFAARSTVRAFGVFRTNLTSAATVTFALYTNPGPVLVWSSAVSGPAPGYGQAVAIAAADQLADYAVITFDDGANPDNHINVGGLFIGPAWLPATGSSWATTFSRTDRTDEVTSIGGQEYPTPRYQQRWLEIDLQNVRSAELWADLGELDRLARLGGNVLAVRDRTSASLAQEAVFGRLSSLTPVSYPSHSFDRFGWRGRITERL